MKSHTGTSSQQVKSVEPGSTHHAWQFGCELFAKLNYMAAHPSVIQPIFGSLLTSGLQDTIKRSWKSPEDFDLLLFMAKRNARKNNHCWIVVSDFWSEVMHQVKYEFGYKVASNTFLRHFCKFSQHQMHDFAENFHVHFFDMSKLGLAMDFWKTKIIQEHGTGWKFIKTANASLKRLDNGIYPEIGFVSADPEDVYLRSLRKSDKSG